MMYDFVQRQEHSFSLPQYNTDIVYHINGDFPMKKYRFSSILLLLVTLVSLLTLPAAAVEDDLDLYCTNAVLIDANYDEVLYEYNAHSKAYPASMTKVMTALLTLEAMEAGTNAANDGSY